MMRRPAWLVEPPSLTGAALLLLAGGGIGWQVHQALGAAVGVLIGLLVAVALATLIELA